MIQMKRSGWLALLFASSVYAGDLRVGISASGPETDGVGAFIGDSTEIGFAIGLSSPVMKQGFLKPGFVWDVNYAQRVVYPNNVAVILDEVTLPGQVTFALAGAGAVTMGGYATFAAGRRCADDYCGKRGGAGLVGGLVLGPVEFRYYHGLSNMTATVGASATHERSFEIVFRP